MSDSAAYVALLGQDKRMTSQILNIKNNSLETAVMVAVRNGNLDCMEEVAKLHGVDWETKNGNNESMEDAARLVNTVIMQIKLISSNKCTRLNSLNHKCL